MKTYLIILLQLLIATTSFAQNQDCKVSTDDTGGYYEISERRVNIVSTPAMNRIDTNGESFVGYRVFEHSSKSCDFCNIRSKKDKIFSSFSMAYCLDARIEMCSRLENSSAKLLCSPQMSQLQKDKCASWKARAERFEHLVETNGLADVANGKCKMIQILYNAAESKED